MDEIEYKSLFQGKEKEALEKALDIRKFEIKLYWKRATYFWAFIVANYTAYFFVLAQSEMNNQYLYLTLLSFIGLLLAHAWQLTNKGSKFWQKNWEAHVSLLEKEVTGPLYDVFLNPHVPYKILSPFEKHDCSPARINTIVCTIFSITGLGLFLYNAIHLMDKYSPWLVFGASIFIVIICLSLMTIFSFGHRHDEERTDMIYSKKEINVNINGEGNSAAAAIPAIHHFIDRFFVKTTTIGNQVWMQDNVPKPIYNGCILSREWSKIDDIPSERKGRCYRIVDSYSSGKIINYCESGLYSVEGDDGFLKGVLITPDDEDDSADNLFYSWDAAMNIKLPGWHLPNLEEWLTLFKHIMGNDCTSYNLAKKLKNEYGWITNDIKEKKMTSAYDNLFGFSASPEGSLCVERKYTKDGERDPNPTYKDLDDLKPELIGKKEYACFWTSTQRENGDVAIIQIGEYIEIKYVCASLLPFYRHSVRLIKD